MKLLYYLTFSSALATMCKSKLSTLMSACRDDFQDHCYEADPTNLISLLACAKGNSQLSTKCLDEINKNFLADYTCTEDISIRCPSFGQLVKRDRKSSSNPPPPQQSVPTQPPHEPLPLPPNTGVVPQPANATEPDDSWLTWEFPADFFMSEPPADGMDSLHSKKNKTKTSEDFTCFVNAFPTFSRQCHDAIFQQWSAKQGTAATGPTAEEAYDMMAPPTISFDHKEMTRAIFAIAIMLFVCTLGICVLCCCCRRAKRRAALRVVPEDQEVALTPLPASTMSDPERYVPMASPVTPVYAPPARPVYRPYTGEGIPVALAVHV